MCWKTMTLVAVVLLASFLMTPSASVDKEGFVTYVVYGPGAPRGGWGGPNGWPYGYRPYWGWRRRWWNGPCPGPWCPYY
jgi:hypothetical protein